MNPRWWVIVVAWLVACGSGTCGGSDIAELETLSGDVRRDVASAQGTWKGASVGDKLAMGDGLRTGSKSVARLKLFPEGTALVEPNTVMRFLAQAPGQKDRITLEQGAIELEATGLDLEVHTARAVARLDKGTRVRVRAGEDGGTDVRFDVLVGRVTVEHDGSSTDVLEGGELALNDEPPTQDLMPGATSQAGTQGEVGAKPGEEGANSPEVIVRSDFSLTKLENATIHVASLPLDVRFGLEPCTDGSAPSLDVSGPAGRNVLMPVRGNEYVIVRFAAGAYRLKLRCGKKNVRSEGTLKIQRDPATMELPKTTPNVEVEADGRRYTVRYQNVLPVVTLVWSHAPAAARYTLVVTKASREMRHELTSPKHEFRSGELGEGEYEFSFVASDGHRSANGGLRIIFDNTARSAYLSSPPENSPRPTDGLSLAGTALLRSEVTVDGVPVALDAQGRFRAHVPADASRGALAVRVSHPVTGVHYYLRRFR